MDFDAGNDKDLRLYGKRASLEDNYRAARIMTQNRIGLDYGIIMFNPYSTFETLRENGRFLRSTGVTVKSHIISHQYVAYSGAPLVDMLREDGLLKTNDAYFADRYPYHFSDDRIHKALQVLRCITDWPVERGGIERIRSSSRKLEISSRKEKHSVKSWLDMVRLYETGSTNLFLDIFDFVLYKCEKRKAISFELLQKEFSNRISDISKLWMSISNTYVAISVELKRAEME